MSNQYVSQLYNEVMFRKEAENMLSGIDRCRTIETARNQLIQKIMRLYRNLNGEESSHVIIRRRDCALALMSCLLERSDIKTGFSVAQALWDIARKRDRNDLKAGFFAEMIQWVRGLEGRSDFQFLATPSERKPITGREHAKSRSNDLDRIWDIVANRLGNYSNGLSEESQARRKKRRQRVLETFKASMSDWENWHWHVKHIVADTETLSKLTAVSETERETINRALRGRLPFGITPYYLSLMDDKPGKRDSAIRAQVIPPEDYVRLMFAGRSKKEHSFDFMMETDTSPIESVTRRYPGIVILKPVLTCPQICVYCQRNWEIEQVMAPGAFMGKEKLDAAIKWIKSRPAIHEVLVTGGDPLIMTDKNLEYLLSGIAEIKNIDLIRIGTRMLVTLPMRITEHLAEMLSNFRTIGQRDIAIMTHIEHPYEITADTAKAVERLRCRGISVYNQQVYTFFVSKRFESTLLRILLRRIGIEPYYTFIPKGKEETNSYRVPLSRILQEQKEEARLVPGLKRTDEAVINIPGLGKNYLRAKQHRDLLTVLPDGSRIYEFYPWEMNLVKCQTYLYKDIPILDYLIRLLDQGENPEEYNSIWFYL